MAKLKFSAQSLGLISFLGGLGGALNAWWCYAGFPVSTEDFNAWIIPAGALHGALLALATVFLTALFLSGHRLVQILGIVAVGWLSGWLSYIPLELYIKMQPISFESNSLWGHIVESVCWLFKGNRGDFYYMPYLCFGLVAVVYYLALGFIRLRNIQATSLAFFVAVGCLSGTLGSLWWWILWKPWYFSLLHGVVWGSLVGFGLWESQKKQTAAS